MLLRWPGFWHWWCSAPAWSDRRAHLDRHVLKAPVVHFVGFRKEPQPRPLRQRKVDRLQLPEAIRVEHAPPEGKGAARALAAQLPSHLADAAQARRACPPPTTERGPAIRSGGGPFLDSLVPVTQMAQVAGLEPGLEICSQRLPIGHSLKLAVCPVCAQGFSETPVSRCFSLFLVRAIWAHKKPL
jgi:hypothetical protein